MSTVSCFIQHVEQTASHSTPAPRIQDFVVNAPSYFRFFFFLIKNKFVSDDYRDRMYKGHGRCHSVACLSEASVMFCPRATRTHLSLVLNVKGAAVWDGPACSHYGTRFLTALENQRGIGKQHPSTQLAVLRSTIS